MLTLCQPRIRHQNQTLSHLIEQEPAIRFKTDHNRKVLAFEDPALSTEDEDPENLLDTAFWPQGTQNKRFT